MRGAEPPDVTEASLCTRHLHAGLAAEEDELAIVSLHQGRGAAWRGHRSHGWWRRRPGGGRWRSGGGGVGGIHGVGEGGLGVGGSGVGGGAGGGGGGRKRERLEAPRGLCPHQLQRTPRRACTQCCGHRLGVEQCGEHLDAIDQPRPRP